MCPVPCGLGTCHTIVLSVQSLLWMNERIEITQTHGQGKRMHWTFFKNYYSYYFWKGKVGCRCVEFPFQKDTGSLANEEVIAMEKTTTKKKKDEESSNIKRSRQSERKKRLPDEVCVLIVQWSFQYFNHPRWEGRGDGRCYITRSPLLYFFFLSCSFHSIRYLRAFYLHWSASWDRLHKHDYRLFP